MISFLGTSLCLPEMQAEGPQPVNRTSFPSLPDIPASGLKSACPENLLVNSKCVPPKGPGIPERRH